MGCVIIVGQLGDRVERWLLFGSEWQLSLGFVVIRWAYGRIVKCCKCEWVWEMVLAQMRTQDDLRCPQHRELAPASAIGHPGAALHSYMKIMTDEQTYVIIFSYRKKVKTVCTFSRLCSNSLRVACQSRLGGLWNGFQKARYRKWEERKAMTRTRAGGQENMACCR